MKVFNILELKWLKTLVNIFFMQWLNSTITRFFAVCYIFLSATEWALFSYFWVERFLEGGLNQKHFSRGSYTRVTPVQDLNSGLSCLLDYSVFSLAQHKSCLQGWKDSKMHLSGSRRWKWISIVRMVVQVASDKLLTSTSRTPPSAASSMSFQKVASLIIYWLTYLL